MAQLPAKTKKTIDNYLKALNRNDIPIKEAILLYETLSLGRANPTNDIAFIYSKSFFKKPVLK